MVAPDELGLMWLTHRVISDRIHRVNWEIVLFDPRIGLDDQILNLVR